MTVVTTDRFAWRLTLVLLIVALGLAALPSGAALGQGAVRTDASGVPVRGADEDDSEADEQPNPNAVVSFTGDEQAGEDAAASLGAGCWTEDQRIEDGDQPLQWSDPPAMVIDEDGEYTAILETNFGEIVIELWADAAPITVNNFICLATNGYYDDTPFHRIVADFVIQGGDPTGTGTGGPGYTFEDEPVQGEYEYGAIAMANAGPDTNGSQFFICLEGAADLPPNYNLFGIVVDGLDVVAEIASVETEDNGRGEQSAPVEPVILETVTIVVGGA